MSSLPTWATYYYKYGSTTSRACIVNNSVQEYVCNNWKQVLCDTPSQLVLVRKYLLAQRRIPFTKVPSLVEAQVFSPIYGPKRFQVQGLKPDYSCSWKPVLYTITEMSITFQLCIVSYNEQAAALYHYANKAAIQCLPMIRLVGPAPLYYWGETVSGYSTPTSFPVS